MRLGWCFLIGIYNLYIRAGGGSRNASRPKQTMTNENELQIKARAAKLLWAN